MPLELILKGPERIVKSTGIIKPLSRSDIESAWIDWKGEKFILPQNEISMELDSKNQLFIYHMYDSKKISGRWYDRNFGKMKLKENTLTYHMKDFEDFDSEGFKTSPATFHIVFTKQGVHRLEKYLGDNLTTS
jgi:hypothetical protein